VDLIISPNPYKARPTEVLSNRFLLMLDISPRISFYIGEKIGKRGEVPSLKRLNIGFLPLSD